MPRLRTTLALCVLALLFSIAATALLSSVQRLSGSVILDPGPSHPGALHVERTRVRHGEHNAARTDTGTPRVMPAIMPQPVFSPPPRYPIQALRQDRGGLVRIRVDLDAGGRVTEARVVESSGDAALDRAALAAAQQWQFRMTPQARRSTIVPIRFRIDPQPR